jgi:putative ABC transport system ATP-binding protein
VTAVAAPALLAATGLVRDYPVGDSVVHALRGIDLAVERGTLVAVQGRSGSGKTTLLNILGGLDRPTSGRVLLDGDELTRLPESTLVKLRRTRIAFIFQSFGLIPILSAAENIEVPMRLVGRDPRERTERTRLLLELVGIADRARHRPHELSGGQQQRVAIARALANSPELLLADEPTGQLDSQTGRGIMQLIRGLVDAHRVTALVASHDPIVLEAADRVLELSDGSILSDVPGRTPGVPL